MSEETGQGPASEAAPETDAGIDGTGSTASTAVEAALTRLAELETLPTAEHVDVFEDVHARLQQALSELEGS